MRLALFLHCYQPSTQFPDVFHRVVRECYEPIVSILEANTNSCITLNISGALVEQLGMSYGGLLGRIKSLQTLGRVDLTGSACYHPLLPYIPDDEIRRQVRLNEQIYKTNFGIVIPEGSGFFAPEMSINKHVCQVIKEMGYSYTMADESVLPMGKKDCLNQSRVFIDKDSGLKIVCRHKNLSLDIAFSKLRSISEFLDLTAGMPYVILAMDAETFGHHRPEQMELLRSMLQYYVISDNLKLIKLLNLLEAEPPVEIDVAKSCWGEGFKRWDNCENKIHTAQWKLLNLAIKAVNEYPERDGAYWEARGLLDKGLQSDQFWWASSNPCWHYKMVDRGASLLKEAVQMLPGEFPAKKEAEDLYKEITETGLKLYGDTVVSC